MLEELIAKFLNNFELCISVIAAFFCLLTVLIVCITRMVKAVKAKTKLQDDADLLDTVAPIMQIAESFTNYSGAEKKEYVLTRINQLAIENGINFDVKAISDKIEELIKLSKEVNYKKTNEEEE